MQQQPEHTCILIRMQQQQKVTTNIKMQNNLENASIIHNIDFELH